MHNDKLGLMRRFAIAAAFAASAISTAQATVYVGAWDPTFGAPFINNLPYSNAILGWRGKATIDIPGNCGLTNETITLNNAANCGGVAVVRDALVEFYDNTGNPPNPTIVGSIFWTSPGPNLPIAGVTIGDMDFVNGELDQFETNIFPLDLAPAPNDPLYGNGAYTFALRFVMGFDPGDDSSYYGPLLYWYGDDCEGSCGFSDVINFEPNFTITVVPEPAGLSLLAAALFAAAGFGRVRRRTA